ncbi:MAG: transposase [Planctomycetaceae bacterium]|nr:transposase [Planctomycetaceae bacterium]
MRRYIRSTAGRTLFFTLVTHERQEILTSQPGRHALRSAIKKVQSTHPFRIIAFVLLPDHLHTIWEMPQNDLDYPMRWRLIKTNFTRNWMKSGGAEGTVTASRMHKQERAIWQRRYYEHTCKDENDLKRCVDYTHVNPLKHGLVKRVADWEWSSFHRYVKQGEYPQNWGSSENWFGDEFINAE